MNGFHRHYRLSNLLRMLGLVLIGMVLQAASLSAQVPLATSTYWGGTGPDGDYDVPIVQAPDGTVYVTATTGSVDLPIPAGAWQTARAGSYDIVVARFSADLKTLLAATYLGGSGADAAWPGVDMALAADGTVYVTTSSRSTDWPVSAGAYDSAYAGGYDIVVARLSADLDQLLASTYLGGSMDEGFSKLVCLPGGDVMVVCQTYSLNYPTTSGAFRTTRVGNDDVALSRFDPDLTTLVASTYLGSAVNDWPEVLVADPSGDVYVTGWSQSAIFPTTPGAYMTLNFGDFSAFVSRMSGDLSTLEASTLIGGGKWEFGYGLTLAANGDVWACGHTASSDFPVTAGCVQSAHAGVPTQGSDDDMWIARFDHDLTTLHAATYLGGTGWENGVALVAIPGGVIVGGTSTSTDWPAGPAAFDATSSTGLSSYAKDMVLAVLDSNLTTLQAATYLGGDGGEGVDDLGGLGAAADGGVWIVGSTSSSDMPVNSDAWDTTYNGGDFDWGGDVFLAHLGTDLLPRNASPAPRLEPRSLLSGAGTHPNPFNPRTEVAFHLAADASVRVTVHDAAGRRIAVIADGVRSAGDQVVPWNGRDNDGRNQAAGIYLVRIQAGDRRETVKVMLVK